MVLPDINVWLALAFRFHSHHEAANLWYEGSTEPCCFCRFTQQGFLRLASNPAAFKDEAVTLRENPRERGSRIRYRSLRQELPLNVELELCEISNRSRDPVV